MTERSAKIDAFLNAAGWGDAHRSMLAGDASNRRYLRLARPDIQGYAVLMDAPPDKGEDVRPFVKIATYLTGIGLSAPRIYAQDDCAGLLLIEDLGDDLFARVVSNQPELEKSLYSAATDLLATLHTHTPPEGLALYDAATATALSALVFDWYSPASDPDVAGRFKDCLHDLLARHAPVCDVLIQRDYHAENLLWLPDRDGLARVGLLDFQDAMLGHRAYDLVSLLQDARRDVPPSIETQMVARYARAANLDLDPFQRAYAALGAQRNLRILGVFARLCVRDGKPHYVDLMPRVWGLLQRDLTHPALAPLRDIIAAHVPAPSPELMEQLKSKCATIPAQ
ncbi:MAG: phosphotransferase [Pseudomonadota bacterium]